MWQPPKQQAVTLRTVGKYTSVSILPSLENLIILQPPHLYVINKVTLKGDAFAYLALHMQPSLSIHKPSAKLFFGRPSAMASMNTRRFDNWPSL